MDTRHGRRGMGEASLVCARDDLRTSRGAFVVAQAGSVGFENTKHLTWSSAQSIEATMMPPPVPPPAQGQIWDEFGVG